MTDIETLAENIDQFFQVFSGIFVLFMQTGFAFLEAGSVRSKNTTNIILKNVLDAFIGAIVYYAVGYAFAYGEPGNAFIGHNHFFATNVVENLTEAHYQTPNTFYSGWFFQYVFAATAATIVSGAMAERSEFTTYIIYCSFITGFIYPCVSHWAWAENGWLRTGAGIENLRYIDYAGSGVVHLVGGVAACTGAAFVGPRIGRFNKDGSCNYIPGHSVTVASLGGFVLFVGFLAYNGGSQETITKPGDGLAVSISIMNTVLSGSAGAIVSMVLYKITYVIRREDNFWSLIMTINGSLTGMVAISAGCNEYEPWTALIVGSIAGISFIFWHHMMLKLKIDDPLDAVAVHGGGGLTGVLLAPLFVTKGLKIDGEYVGGIVYGGHELAFKSFGWNLVGALTIIIWTGALSSIMFGTMKALGILRVKPEVEINGLDSIKHGEPAYPHEAYCDEKHPGSENGCHFPHSIYLNSAITLDVSSQSQSQTESPPPEVHVNLPI